MTAKAISKYGYSCFSVNHYLNMWLMKWAVVNEISIEIYLALFETWPRYWQKGRVKRRQNSLHVNLRLLQLARARQFWIRFTGLIGTSGSVIQDHRSLGSWHIKGTDDPYWTRTISATSILPGFFLITVEPPLIATSLSTTARFFGPYIHSNFNHSTAATTT